MMSRRAWSIPSLLLVTLVACGSEPFDTARIEPMGPRTQQAPESDPLVDVPAIASIRFEPEQPLAGRTARADVSLVGPNRDAKLEYTWTLDGQVLGSDPSSVDLSATRPGARLQLTVTPRVAGAAGVPLSHAVRLASPPPRVLGVSFLPAQGLTADASVEARPIVEDGDPHRTRQRFQWIVNGRRQSAYDARFSTAGLRRGDEIQVEVVAYTPDATSDPHLSDVIVLANAPPMLVPRPLATNDSGGVETRLEAADPDGDAPLVFALIDGPPGLSISRTGELTWPSAHTKPGHHVVELEVEDTLGASTRSRFSVDVGSPAAPAP